MVTMTLFSPYYDVWVNNTNPMVEATEELHLDVVESSVGDPVNIYVNIVQQGFTGQNFIVLN